MKKVFIVLAILMTVLVAGCGVPKEKYQALQTENAQLKAKKELLSTEKTKLEEKVDGKKAQLATVPKPLRNSSYQELRDFLLRDKTNERKLVPFTLHYALELRENAKKEGIRAGIQVLFLKERTYYINIFETTDQGIIYIEPQNDRVVKVKVGERYWTLNGWKQPSFDDTIVRINPPIW